MTAKKITLATEKQVVFSANPEDITKVSLFMRFNESKSAKMTIHAGKQAYNLGFYESSDPKDLLQSFESLGIKTMDISRFTNIFAVVIVVATFLWIYLIQK